MVAHPAARVNPLAGFFHPLEAAPAASRSGHACMERPRLPPFVGVRRLIFVLVRWAVWEAPDHVIHVGYHLGFLRLLFRYCNAIQIGLQDVDW